MRAKAERAVAVAAETFGAAFGAMVLAKAAKAAAVSSAAIATLLFLMVLIPGILMVPTTQMMKTHGCRCEGAWTVFPCRPYLLRPYSKIPEPQTGTQRMDSLWNTY